LENQTKRIHAFTNDALGDDDAVGLAQKVKNKEVSPEELVKASIARAQKVDPHLNAIITNTFEKALEDSKKEPKGFFAGVPTFIKDLTNIDGVKTYYGSEAFLNIPASKKTDPIAKQIFAQGFIHMGQSTLPEFGFTCTTEFLASHQKDTRNPWGLAYSSGGSSGGSAALVAAGVVPIAHTADGGGSTRIPASCCGLVGLKASRGRLLASELFQQQIVEVAIDGVTSRSVRDTVHFYAEAEKYYKNPKLKPMGVIGPIKRKLKIGYTNDSLKGLKGDGPTEAVLNKTVKLLAELGHEVKQIQIPVEEQFVDDFVYLWEMLGFLTKQFGWTMFGKHYDKSKLSNLLNGLAKSYPKNIWRTPGFIYRLKKSYQDYNQMFVNLDIDIVLTPVLAHTPPKIGHLGVELDYETIFKRMTDWACYTPYANASGGPAISLPMGQDPSTDLPIGMMFWGNHGEDGLLLELAYQLEEASPWKKITD
jgi:amidase